MGGDQYSNNQTSYRDNQRLGNEGETIKDQAYDKAQ